MTLPVAPPFREAAPEQTVKVLIQDERRQVLLVQERGKPQDTTEPDGSGQWAKPPGWGAPGGKVEGTEDDIVRGIHEQFRRLRMDPKSITVRRALKRCRELGDPRVTLTAVKEVLEEAGIFIAPFALDLWKRRREETIWLVRARPAIVGHAGPGDVHIIRASWHPATNLPENTYRRTRAMVRRAVLRPEGGRA
ncbi:MAG TPA: hypothetical protein VD862_01145 [Candidatus Paceibacterota bacterium]|nr:hypothetical protein [Candidatus Paceibacterota bacterium]